MKINMFPVICLALVLVSVTHAGCRKAASSNRIDFSKDWITLYGDKGPPDMEKRAKFFADGRPLGFVTGKTVYVRESAPELLEIILELILKNDTDSINGFSVTNGDALSVEGKAKLMGDSLNTLARFEMKFNFSTNDFLESERLFLHRNNKADILFNKDEIDEIILKLEKSRSLSRSGFDYSKVVLIE